MPGNARQHARTQHLNANKLIPRHLAPFTITDIVDHDTYRLQVPHTMSRIHNMFHVSQLKPYLTDRSYRPPHQPPLGLPTGWNLSALEEGEHFVKSILSHRVRCSKREYFVKWMGYPETEASWQAGHAFAEL
eukprot:360166-Chlamydomonas_euryale.AAC.6